MELETKFDYFTNFILSISPQWPKVSSANAYLLAQAIAELFYENYEIPINNIANYKSYDLAEGLALDDIGDDLSEPRLGNSDDIYRFLLKTKIIASASSGTIPDLIQVVKGSLPNSPNLKPVIINDPENVHAVKITIDGGRYTASQVDILIRRLKQALPAGIKATTEIRDINVDQPIYIGGMYEITKKFSFTINGG